MIHYHGLPITPQSVLYELAGKHFCASYATARSQVSLAASIGQSLMLDNGAFTFWKQGGGDISWAGYYEWCETWLAYPTTWAVIPDVIDGSEEDNDLLLAEWFQQRLPRGAPVWHLHESIDRLKTLCHGYERVCIGSSGAFSEPGSASWTRRMDEAMNALCGSGNVPCWLHMLRGMRFSGSDYPFSSVDSTDVARNHAGSHSRNRSSARAMADRWDALQCPAHWTHHDQLGFCLTCNGDKEVMVNPSRINDPQEARPVPCPDCETVDK